MDKDPNSFIKSAKYGAEKYLAPDEIILESKIIWKKVKDSGVKRTDIEGADRLYESLIKEHKDFANTFPVIFQWMVKAQDYTVRAFQRFINWYQANAVTGEQDRESFMKNQAEFMIFLLRERHPNVPKSVLTEMREKLYKVMHEEVTLFEDMSEEAVKEYQESVKDVDYERRNYVYLQLLKSKLKKADDESEKKDLATRINNCQLEEVD